MGGTLTWEYVFWYWVCRFSEHLTRRVWGTKSIVLLEYEFQHGYAIFLSTAYRESGRKTQFSFSDESIRQRFIFCFWNWLENIILGARANNISISTCIICNDSCCDFTFYACHSLGEATRPKIFETETRFEEFGPSYCQNHFKVGPFVKFSRNHTFFSASFSSEMAETSVQFDSRPSAVWFSSFDDYWRVITESFRVIAMQFDDLYDFNWNIALK